MKTGNFKKTSFAVVALLALFTYSCQDDVGKNGQKADTPTSGHIMISVDESLKPMADAEVKTFMQIYTKAKIDASFKSQAEVLQDMFKDTARAIIIPRKMTADEEKFYTDKKLKVKQVRIAFDAVALIENNKNADSTLTMAQFNDILHGKISNWKEIGGNNNKIQVVFDNTGSSTVDYISKKFNLSSQLPGNVFAVKSNEEVINYVEKTPNAIGIIGVSWIGNEDSIPNSFLKRIKVIALNPPDTAKTADQKFYPPFQAWIKSGYYPLTREVYAITPEFFNGLGSGLIDFMAGDKGQIKILQSGLVPATMPIRMVHTKKEF
jgi:phosphate transport system substrate-binding protein